MSAAPAFASNKAHLTHVFAETAKGNGRPFVEALDDNVSWTIHGSTPWSKTFRGKKSVLDELLGPLSRVLTPPLKLHAERMLAEGNCVCVEGRGENTAQSGRAYNNRYCWIFEFRDGRVISISEYMDTELVSAVLGGPT
jgi:ketosteroid isomerase-like protein